MSLMMTLDDVMSVMIRGGFLDEEWIDEDGTADYVRSELEQKCYMVMKRKSRSWFDMLKGEIEELTDPKELASHIAVGDLKEHLEGYRDVMMAQLALAAQSENGKGKWIPIEPDTRGYTDMFRCSRCNTNTHMPILRKECEHNFCPVCGAEMEDES